MLIYEKQFYKRVFSGPTHKQAYKKATKWLAVNIISNDELKSVNVRFEKGRQQTGKILPTIAIILSVGIEEKQHREKMCTVCKEVHSNFFMNEETNCGWCKAVAYQNRLDDVIRIKTEHYKSCLKKILKEKENDDKG